MKLNGYISIVNIGFQTARIIFFNQTKSYRLRFFIIFLRVMIKLSRLTTENIVKILEEGLDFANGKVMKAKSDVFVANFFLKTVPERK
jgi:hypothetical protein